MGFTDLISRLLSDKAIPFSNYDEEFVVETVSKIKQALNPLNKTSKYGCNAVADNLENSKPAVLPNKNIASILNLINCSLQICNYKPSLSESRLSNVFLWILLTGTFQKFRFLFLRFFIVYF